MSIIIRGSGGGSVVGGFPPGDVTGISVTADYEKLTIKWTDPKCIFVGNQKYADFEWCGTKLIRKQGSYPKTILDGTVVCDNTVKNQYNTNGFVDTGLENNVTYYYRFFPYSKKGVYNTNAELVCSGTPIPFHANIYDNTWDQIADAARTGYATIWARGSEISINLSGTFTESITLQVWDYNRYNRADGSGKARLLFGCKNLMKNLQYMNSSNTNCGGWGKSYMRNTVMQQIYDSLPADVKAVVTPVLVPCDTGYDDSFAVTKVTDKIFIPSHGDVCTGGSHSYLPSECYTNIPIFTTYNSSRKKKLSNGSGNAVYWWTRSSITSADASFSLVASDGSTGNYLTASSGAGVCFCFCVG